MDRKRALMMATDLCGFWLKNYSFGFDRSVARFGYCRYKENSAHISLSAKLTELNSEDQVLDTILHEIAHALVGRGNGHNRVWRYECVEVGCRPARCGEGITADKRYQLKCENCGMLNSFRYKKRNKGDWRHKRCGGLVSFVSIVKESH